VWSVVGRRTARPGTLSLHDALPIYLGDRLAVHNSVGAAGVLGLLGQNLHTTGIDCTVGAPQHAQRLPVHGADVAGAVDPELAERSEENTSELQSRFDLVCRLLLAKQ